MPFHIAQVNIGRIVAPLDDPQLAGFISRLDEINALADAAPGFVWRLQTAAGNATYYRPYEDDRILVNLSVWQGIEELRAFVYRSAHSEVMRNRLQWFERPAQMHLALWWASAGHLPSIDEAKERLEHLRRHGPGPYAFSFAQPYPAPGAIAT